ncbi:cystathionine beta-synthase [Anopheles darlingi]|uniref:cystathionine beta-synthase n=1 Tax=Anopheles darlingi TaxID=43151 RepID=UPI00210037C2|nr:cystathionine beta-synthase [Anopheles darlingi]XP_049541396.1 cystathionine beta-synthase [Anopheles darlingi]
MASQQQNGNHRGCPMNGCGHQATGSCTAPARDLPGDPMINFIRPDQPSRCTWSAAGTSDPSPHHHEPLVPRPALLSTILEAVGQTPLVKLNKIPASYGLKCNVYAKCEFLNPGGSVKDRIGVRMVLEAERKGLLKPGCTIIEPTSGNTGIGLAMAAAAKGYQCLIVMPEKMSNEKVDTLKALGAQVIRTPTEAAFDSPEGLIAVSQSLQRSIPDSIILDQYRNAGNPLAHYDGTGAEIVEQLGGNVDMVVIGTGTGGTLTGIGRQIKQSCPTCKVIAADPEGSILAEPEELNRSNVSFYEVEGVGYDFLPTVLDRTVVDRWYKFNDREALPLARRLIRDEGLLCGGSSGGNLHVALEAAKELKEGQNCVVILPDNIRNYLTKFVSDNWMEARAFKESINTYNHPWWNDRISSIKMSFPITVTDDKTIAEAIALLKQHNLNQLPVVTSTGAIKGVVYLPNLMGKLLNCLAKPTDSLKRAIFKQFVKIDHQETVGRASRILEKDPFIVITRTDQIEGDVKHDEALVGVLTQRHIFDFIANHSNGAEDNTQ